MSAEPVISEIPAEADPKRVRILDGAMKVFLAYGFQRSTMDDIARAAEVSRPALYLQFRNKIDIYRALAGKFLAGAMVQARVALARDASLQERLGRLFEGTMELLKPVEESPHGAEILDMRNSLAGDLIEEWRVEMVALIGGTIDREVAGTGVDLAARGITATLLAEMLMDSLEGMKLRGAEPRRHCEAVEAYVRVISLAAGP